MSDMPNTPNILMALESSLEGKSHLISALAKENRELEDKIMHLNIDIKILTEENSRLKEELSIFDSGVTSGAINNGQV